MFKELGSCARAPSLRQEPTVSFKGCSKTLGNVSQGKIYLTLKIAMS